MSTSIYDTTPQWILSRITEYFYRVETINEIMDGQLKDDPSNGIGNKIGKVIAGRILTERNKLSRKHRYHTL